MEITDWISAAFAALAFVLTLITWFLKEQSRQARLQAQDARDNAKKSAESLAGMAEEMRKLVDAAQGPTLEGEYDGRTLVLTNGESKTLEIVGMRLDDFLVEHVGDSVTVPAKSIATLTMPEAFGIRLPDSFEVQLSDGRNLLVAVRRVPRRP